MKKIYLLFAFFIIFCRLSSQSLTDAENYLYKKTYLTGSSDPVQKYAESVQYLDGLGRVKQIIDVKATPLGKDLVIPVEYDEFGRKAKDYLPIPVQTTNLGFQSSVTGASVNTYYGVTNAFNEKDLEKSPLSRVFQSAFPGDTWIKNGGHTKKYDYDANSTADLVKRYQITTIFDNINQMYTSTPTTATFYDENRLHKLIVKDEDDNETIIFKDLYGHVVLIRKNDGANNIDTYYVYDKFDQLAYIIPPLATVSATLTPTVLNDLCYQYRYDNKKRVVEKKLPGKGWEYLIYDNQDRQVMFQDANLGASLQWMFTKYDQYGRVAYTGIYTSTQIYDSAGRKFEQGEIDGKGYNNVTRMASGFAQPGLVVYYDNDALKNYPNDITKLLSVNYYDTYPAGAPTLPSTIRTQSVLPQNAQTSSISTKGFATASFINNVETNGWTKSYNWYDTKGRTIGTHTVYISGGSTITESLLDFVGAAKETYTSHKRKSADLALSIMETFEYDDQYRLKVNKHTVNGGIEEILAQNSYDEIGRLVTKKVGGSNINNPLQTINYSYNIRGWLTGVNSSDIPATSPYSLNNGKLFAFNIRYDDPDNPRLGPAKYNGNIAEMDWIDNGSSLKRYGYQYDGLNRLLAGNYQDPGEALPESHINDEIMTYDLNGNIKTLVRKSKHLKYNTPIVIDDLDYHYSGNRLTSIVDNPVPGASYNPSGYEGGGLPISYDPNGSGNMTAMPDKGITSISYNFLDLPTQINKNANVINYYYRADGAKVKKKFTLSNASGIKIINTEYLDGFQYSTPNIDPIRKALEEQDIATVSMANAGELEAFSSMDRAALAGPIGPSNPQTDDVMLSFFPTAEGYYDYENSYYIYQYKDQVGNIRVSYTKDATGVLKIMDRNDFYPFGMNFLKPFGNASVYDPIAIPYNYKFQEQELQETGFYSFKWRQYMPDVGRFFNPDPLSEKYAYQSHYNFSENRVTDGRELEGLEVEVLNDNGDFTSYSAAQSFANNTGGYVVLGQGEIPQVQHDIQGVTVQGPPATHSNTSNLPTMGPMPETMGSSIANLRDASAPASLGLVGMIGKGILDGALDGANYLRNVNPFSDQRDYNGLYPRMTNWDGVPLGGQEGLDRGVNGVLFFGSFLTGGLSSEANAGKNVITQSESVLNHIFRPSSGHVNPTTITSQNRYLKLFEKVANNPNNLNPSIVGETATKNGVEGFSQTFRNGKQIWAQSRNGKIFNAGVNKTPK